MEALRITPRIWRRPGFKRKFDENRPVFFDANHADVEYILGDLRVKRRI